MTREMSGSSRPVADRLSKFTSNPVAGFVPWIAFWVIATGPSTWLYGALTAAIVAVILGIPDAYRRKVKILDAGTVVFFVAIVVAGLTLGAKDGQWMDRYSNPLSSGVLALIALVSLLFVPFTEQYAREDTPPEVWDSPVFKKINRVLTLMWGLVFVVTAVCGLIAIAAPSTSDWTNWVIPTVLLVAAFKFTGRYPDMVTAKLDSQPVPRVA